MSALHKFLGESDTLHRAENVMMWGGLVAVTVSELDGGVRELVHYYHSIYCYQHKLILTTGH